MIVPVAAVADTVATSNMSVTLRAKFELVPLNVCSAVNVVAVPGATKSVPAVAAVRPEPVPLMTPLRLVVTDKVPLLVTGEPETEKPVGMESPTEVTVPVTVDAIVTEPEALVMLMPEPAVRFATVYVLPLPISKAPLPGTVAVPVPPLPTGNVPVTPELRGSPVAFVSVAADGVPRFGVVSVGLVESTTEPLPVEVVTPVPPFATASVPPKVSVPLVVIGEPLKVRPVVPPDAATLVTVPVPPVAAIVMLPLPLVTLIPEPAVSVVLDKLPVAVLPINN